MKQFCQYHPTTPAHWYCETCNRLLCPRCVEAREMGGYHQGQKLHMCPNCNRQVQWLGVSNIIDPFWKRIPRFFLYPLTPRPLILTFILSIVTALFLRPGLIGLIAQAGIWGVTFKYAYAILQNTASGNLTTPKLDSKTLFENIGPVAKQIGIYLALFFAGAFVFTRLGMAVGLLFVVAATLFLPSMIILLVTTESLIQAINPMMFVTLAFRIGWGYLLMYFFYSILGGAPALVGQHVIQYLPPLLQLFLFTWVKIYYTFISYHLMGYVILQYHEDIGYQVDFEDFKDEETDAQQAEPDADTPEGRLLRRVNQMVKDGDHEGAKALIENETGSDGVSDPLLSERYYTLLKVTGATDKLAAHGGNHLSLLVQQGNKEASMAAYRECLAAQPDFTPAATALFKVGGWLNESGDGKAAIGALNRLTKAHPQDPLVPKAYFRAAQIFNDRLMNPAKAKNILNGLIKKFPEHDIIPFAERYLAEMG
jgi:tetratricopeptide (TPR) repeat protein